MLALIAVIIAAILLLPSCGSRGGKAEADTESTTLVKAGDKAPDFTVEMFDGTKTSLAELKGKVVLLNFWATWCPPCRQELTRVQKDIMTVSPVATSYSCPYRAVKSGKTWRRSAKRRAIRSRWASTPRRPFTTVMPRITSRGIS